MGNCYRCSVWIVLLLHVQESGEKPITILPYSCIGRYVWFKLHLLINRMGILTLSKAHPGKGAFFIFPQFAVTINPQEFVGTSMRNFRVKDCARLQLPYMVIAF